MEIPNAKLIPVEADHRSICKFSKSDSGNYKEVGGWCTRLIKGAVADAEQSKFSVGRLSAQNPIAE
jgi:hypothetical protein